MENNNWMYEKKLIKTKFFGLIKKYKYEWHHVVIQDSTIYLDGKDMGPIGKQYKKYYKLIKKHNLEFPNIYGG